MSDLHPVLCQMPEDWPIVRIDDLFAIQQGKQVSAKHRDGTRQRPFLRTKNVYWGRLDLTELDAMHFSEEEERRLRLLPGDLLTCEGGWVGRTAIWNGETSDCLYQNHLHRLRRISTDTDPWFALYWLWYAFDVGEVYFGRQNVTTIPNLSKSRLGELPMPSPRGDEQRQIAGLLSAVQRAIERQDRLIALTAELKKALMTRLFTEGTRSEPLRQTESGRIPASWKIRTVQQLIDDGIIDKPLDGNHGNIHPKQSDYVEAGIPFVMASDLGDGSIDLAQCKFIKKTQADSLQKGFAREGDVLISHKATIGVTAIVPPVEHYVMLTPQVTYYRVLDAAQLSNKYLRTYFDSHHFQRRFAMVADDGSTRAYIGITKQRQLPILLPTLDEQDDIAHSIKALERKAVVAKHQRLALSQLFRTLLHQLMTAQIRVHGLNLSALANAMREAIGGV